MNMPKIIKQSIRLQRAVVYLPRQISSRSSMKVQLEKICLPLFFRRLSTRRSVDLPVVNRSADMWHFSAVRLHFLSELKAAFIRTLNLDDEHAITPENSHLFAAIGSALNYKEDVETTLGSLQQRLSTGIKLEFEVARLDPLFASQEDYDAFTSRHGNNHVETGDLKNYSGNCYPRY